MKTFNGTSRRKAPRFALALPVSLPGAAGITRDISTHGVFFECDSWDFRREAIEFRILFPTEGEDGELGLHCRGRVARVEKIGERFGVAASVSARSLEMGTGDVAVMVG